MSSSARPTRTTHAAFRIFLVVWTLALAFAALEITGRAYYMVRKHQSFWITPRRLVDLWYPEVRAERAKYRPGEVNVLILGGSVLHHDFGNVEGELRQRLEASLGQPVAVVNLAMLAHGTLDSCYKYQLVRDLPFDAVLVYHGINELRANNVPPRFWRDDYSHYAWYDEINFYFRHPWLAGLPFIAPYYVKHLYVALFREVLHPQAFVKQHRPRPDWMVYGSTIRTAGPFRANLERIIALARAKQDPIVLMTFASYVPKSYTLERFKRGELPYAAGDRKKEIELWGFPENIVKGLEVHNTVIRSLAAEYRLPLADEMGAIGGRPEYFIDICHLSAAGVTAFVEQAVPVVSKTLVEGRGRLRNSIPGTKGTRNTE